MRVGLGVVHLDDPVAVLVEHARVEELILRIELAAAAVLGNEVGVRELTLRVVVPPAVPGMARQCVEVPPVLLGVLAVISLVAREPEDSLLEDRVAAVPERQCEAQPLLDVREAGESVLAPAIRPRARLIMGQVLPRRAALAVVLADRAPLALAQVGAPVVPIAGVHEPVLETSEGRHPFAFCAHPTRRIANHHADRIVRTA